MFVCFVWTSHFLTSSSQSILKKYLVDTAVLKQKLRRTELFKGHESIHARDHTHWSSLSELRWQQQQDLFLWRSEVAKEEKKKEEEKEQKQKKKEEKKEKKLKEKEEKKEQKQKCNICYTFLRLPYTMCQFSFEHG